MSADPSGAKLINPMDQNGKPKVDFNIIESLNWYSYVSNNPVKYTDPTGKLGVVGFWLSGSDISPDRSLFTSQYEQENTFGNFMCGVSTQLAGDPGTIIGIIDSVTGVGAGDLLLPSDNVVNYGDRKSYLAGAKNEISKLDSLLKSDMANDNADFKNFLNDQMDLLTTGYLENILFDDKQKESVKNGYEMNPYLSEPPRNPNADPSKGIDYVQEYEKIEQQYGSYRNSQLSQGGLE